MDTGRLKFGQVLEVVIEAHQRPRGTKAEIADALKVTRRSFSRWVSGKDRIPPNRVGEVEDYFGLPRGFMGRPWASLNALRDAAGEFRTEGDGQDMGVGRSQVHEPSIVAEGTPKYIQPLAGDTSQPEGSRMIAQRCADALARTIRRNELGGTDTGRQWLEDELHKIAQDFVAANMDASDFLAAIQYVRRYKRVTAARKAEKRP